MFVTTLTKANAFAAYTTRGAAEVSRRMKMGLALEKREI
jgi:hypothetical protein